MFVLLLFVSLLASLLLQMAYPAAWTLAGMRPPFVLALALYYALNHRPAAGLIVAFAGGLWLDSLSLVPLGYSSLYLICMVMFASRYRHQVLTEAPVTAAFFGGLAGCGQALFMIGMLISGGYVYGRVPLLLIRLGSAILLALIVTPIVFRLMTSLHRSLNLLDEEEAQHVNA